MKNKLFTGNNIRDILLIFCGTLISSAGFSFVTFPNGIVSGGVTGAAQILNLLFGLPVGVTSIVINIPFFLCARKLFGNRFLVLSAITMLLANLFIDAFSSFSFVLTDDILLASVYGGLLKGFGWGLAYSTGAAGGGGDITARIVRRKRPYWNFGTISLAIDACVVAIYALIARKLDCAMYTVITMYVSSRVVNLVLYGAMNSSICYVITIYPHEISDAIGSRLHRGATLMKGEGAYSGEDRTVLLCAIKQNQIAELKKIITEIDPRSFVIVTRSHEVFGKNFSLLSNPD